MYRLARKAVTMLIGLAVLAALVLVASAHWLTDLWWFQEVGYPSVFWVNLLWPWAIQIAFGLVLTAFFYVNALAAAEAVRTFQFRMDERFVRIPWRWVRFAFLAGSVVLGFLSSSTVSRYWDVVARFVHRADFGQSDPMFGRDVGFFVFELPFYRLLYTTAMGASVLALIIVGALYLFTRALEFESGRGGSLRRPLLALGTLVIASIVLLGIAPGIVQQFVVDPNEIELERPYIERGIAMTRYGYDLNRIESRVFDLKDDLDRDALMRNEGTLTNVRLWDWRPMLTSFRQLQEIRFYYSFPDIDVARYRLANGEYRQVMTAARELDVSQIPNRTWINEHLQYTHGYGFIMSPVNESTAEGMPRFFIQDIPPRTVYGGLVVRRPEIYFGELTNQYVIVGTRIDEFDYPLGDTNAWTRYEGTGGVAIGSLLRRAAFAVRMGTMAILLSNDITEESRILFRRNVRERVTAIAPFLRYDRDPYLVLADGRLFWIVDAYTTANGLPYSEPTPGWGNYVRNSVKVVVDAYNGDVTFYAFDRTDPVLQVYDSLYRGLFTSIDRMPGELRAHLRYPEDFFTLQARVYAVYHMTDPTIFYNQEDVWHVARELFQGREQEMSPYYTILQLPDADEPEMVLMLPFTPARRNNMVAWLAARNDGDRYGRLIAYRFPRDQLVFGPMQIEARIDQDTAISELLTLWDQAGSQVIRGNLLVLPIENSILYVKPIFLRAETADLPELVRVIVAFGPRLVMMPTLEMALAAIFGEPETAPGDDLRPRTGQSAGESPGGEGLGPWRSDLAALAAEALEHWSRAQEALRRGDWTGYGRELEEVESLLKAIHDRASGEVDHLLDSGDAPEAIVLQ